MCLSEAIGYYKANEPRGEFVLVIEGRSGEELIKEKEEKFRAMDLEEHMAMYESRGIDHKEAMKKVAADRGVSKRDIYAMLQKQ